MILLPALTSGCLQTMMSGAEFFEDEQPILQVLGTKQISNSVEPRFRVLLSDGKHLESFAMIATQLNFMVNNGLLSEFAIVRVKKHVVSVVDRDEEDKKRVLIIVALDVMRRGEHVGRVIGDPISIKDATKLNRSATSATEGDAQQVPALTTGCLEMIMTGAEIGGKPILQVLGIKRIAGNNGRHRYRVLLSDGRYLQSFAMLSPQLNDMVTNGSLTDFSIIQVNDYINTVCRHDFNLRRILIIVALDVLRKCADVAEKIGHPINLEREMN